MIKHKTYNRFDKIYKSINNSRVFNTKLGPRCIIMSKNKYEIFITYNDGDSSELFHIGVKNNGRIKIYASKIDEHAIFSAIYEIECILNNKTNKNRDRILEKLFENIEEFSFKDSIFGFTTYR